MTEGLVMYTVYDRPRDFPHSVVVRRFTITAEGERPDPIPYIISPSLETARAALLSVQPGLFRLGRVPEDDPVIVEVWM